MQKNIEVKAETLEQVREKLQNEIPSNFFLKETNEYKPEIEYHYYYCNNSFAYAIENAKKHLPNKSFIKEIIKSEIIENTNIYIPFKMKTDSETQAKLQVKNYIENKYTTILDTRKDFYRISKTQLIKKGFKGIFGIGTTLNTYEVKVHIFPVVLIKYKTWAVIKAKITDEKFFTENGIKKDDINIKINQKVNQEKGKKESELKSKGYCDKCNKIVETYESSYDYDDGWFTRECEKCKICGNIINAGKKIQN